MTADKQFFTLQCNINFSEVIGEQLLCHLKRLQKTVMHFTNIGQVGSRRFQIAATAISQHRPVHHIGQPVLGLLSSAPRYYHLSLANEIEQLSVFNDEPGNARLIRQPLGRQRVKHDRRGVALVKWHIHHQSRQTIPLGIDHHRCTRHVEALTKKEFLHRTGLISGIAVRPMLKQILGDNAVRQIRHQPKVVSIGHAVFRLVVQHQ
ncbi:hypothetical protein D9M71_447160 [compost metagenome]